MALGKPGQAVVKAVSDKSKDEVPIRTLNSLADGGVIELRGGKEERTRVPADYKLTDRGKAEVDHYFGDGKKAATSKGSSTTTKGKTPAAEDSAKAEPVAA